MAWSVSKVQQLDLNQVLVGGLVAIFGIFPFILGMSNHPLIDFPPSFFRGVAKNHQPGYMVPQKEHPIENRTVETLAKAMGQTALMGNPRILGIDWGESIYSWLPHRCEQMFFG